MWPLSREPLYFIQYSESATSWTAKKHAWILGQGKKFFSSTQCPVRLRSPPILLFSRLLGASSPGLQRLGHAADGSSLRSASRPPLTHVASWHIQWQLVNSDCTPCNLCVSLGLRGWRLCALGCRWKWLGAACSTTCTTKTTRRWRSSWDLGSRRGRIFPRRTARVLKRAWTLAPAPTIRMVSPGSDF